MVWRQLVILGIAIRSETFLYELVLYLHILTAIVGFGSTFVWPLLSVKARALPPEQGLALNRAVFDTAKKVTTPFTLATGVLGIILVVLSDELYSFAQPWISAGLTLWLLGAGIALGLHTPNLKALLALQEEMVATGPHQGPPPQAAEMAARGKKAQMLGGVLHLLFALVLIVMVFLPEVDV
jgi:hypothetical protein